MHIYEVPHGHSDLDCNKINSHPNISALAVIRTHRETGPDGGGKRSSPGRYFKVIRILCGSTVVNLINLALRSTYLSFDLPPVPRAVRGKPQKEKGRKEKERKIKIV
jgi:hypothetical protein